MLRNDKGWWWRGAVLLAGLLSMTPPQGRAMQTTTVQDKLQRADGTPARGTVLVSWPSFTAADGSTVAAGSTTVTIAADGSVTVALAPNEGADPQGSYYTAVYHLSDGTVQKEYWVVPQTATASVSEIRAKVVPAAVAQSSVSRQYVDATIGAIQSSYLPLKGGAVTGAITLPADPTDKLQAATKQYVDAHVSSGGASTLPAINTLYTVSGIIPGQVPIMRSVFNERAPGQTVYGSGPGQLNVPGAAWSSPGGVANFNTGGGATFGPGGQSFLDLGHADTTGSLSVVFSGTSQILTWRVDSAYTKGLLLEWRPDGSVQLSNNTPSGVTILGRGSVGSTTSGTITWAFAGRSVSVNVFGTVLAGTVPAGDVTLTQTLFNVNPNGTIGPNGTTILNALTVSIDGSVIGPGAGPCITANKGVYSSDGNCAPVGASSGVAVDSSGHLSSLPEIETRTDANNNITIACSEDKGKGIYDARCTKYAGGLYGTQPAAALQAVEDQINCDMAITPGHVGTLTLPPGGFPVGQLQLAPGSVFEGADGGTGSSTYLLATLNNVVAVLMDGARTTTCSDGAAHTNSAIHSVIKHIALEGCGQGGCVNMPGDTADHPNGGPGNYGLIVVDSQARVEYVSASHFGAGGIAIEGIDSQAYHLFTVFNNEWFLFGHNVAGQVYNPTTDTIHSDIELNSLDGQFGYIETYGTGAEPGTEYGHVVGVNFGGGNSTLSHFFLQLHQIGLYRGYGAGGNARISDFRIDFSLGEGMVITDNTIRVSNGYIDGSCLFQSIVTKLGHCDQIDNQGQLDYFENVVTADQSGFGATVKTGDIYPFSGGTYRGVVGTVENPPGYTYGQGADFEFSEDYTSNAVTGPSPDMSHRTRVVPVDSSPITYTGVTNPLVGKDVWIVGGDANVTLGSTGDGHGNFITCSSHDINLAAPGVLHFVVTTGKIYDYPAKLTEQCDIPAHTANAPIPATSTTACTDGDKAFGAGPSGPGGVGWYVCHPANTWTFYQQTPTATSF